MFGFSDGKVTSRVTSRYELSTADEDKILRCLIQVCYIKLLRCLIQSHTRYCDVSYRFAISSYCDVSYSLIQDIAMSHTGLLFGFSLKCIDMFGFAMFGCTSVPACVFCPCFYLCVCFHLCVCINLRAHIFEFFKLHRPQVTRIVPCLPCVSACPQKAKLCLKMWYNECFRGGDI